MADIAGEAELGKAYDSRLVRRLWTYVRPYKAIFWGAVLLSPVSDPEPVRPYLLKLRIDGRDARRRRGPARWHSSSRAHRRRVHCRSTGSST
jgi:hypothetical protein